MRKRTSYERKGRVLTIHVGGDLDHHVAEEIREKADQMIEDYGIRQVVFDFADSAFMDSSGIGVIMGRYRKLKYAGGTVAVTGVSERLKKIFRMSGLNQIVQYLDA